MEGGELEPESEGKSEPENKGKLRPIFRVQIWGIEATAWCDTISLTTELFVVLSKQSSSFLS